MAEMKNTEKQNIGIQKEEEKETGICQKGRCGGKIHA